MKMDEINLDRLQRGLSDTEYREVMSRIEHIF